MKKWYKLCPFCWEEIREIAKKCRFCGEFLEEEKEVQYEHRCECWAIVEEWDERCQRCGSKLDWWNAKVSNWNQNNKSKPSGWQTFAIVISCIFWLLFFYVASSPELSSKVNKQIDDVIHWNTYEPESLEVYYCRWAWNTQWDADLHTDNLFKSDPAWWWWFTDSEWQTHKNDISKMYNNCLNHKTSIKNDIKTYWYVMNKVNIDEQILAYCVGNRKYLEVNAEKISAGQTWWVTDFTPSISVKDTSYIVDSVKSCVVELQNNPKWFTNNMRK